MTFLAAPAAVSSIAETRIILSADVGQYSPDQARYPDGEGAADPGWTSCSCRGTAAVLHCLVATQDGMAAQRAC